MMSNYIKDEWAKNKGFKNYTEYEDYLAKNIGFENKKDRNRSWHYDRGSLPMSENEDSSTYLGIHIAERVIARKILSLTIGDIKREMPYGNPGFDFVCVDNQRIDIKSTTLDGLNKLLFHIRWNKIPDYFMMIGFNNREDLNVIGIWIIKKDEKIRNSRSKNPGNWPRLCDREGFRIKYDQKYLGPFKKYEVTDKWKNLSINVKDIIT